MMSLDFDIWYYYKIDCLNCDGTYISFERKGLKLDLLDSTETKLSLSNNFNILNNQLEVNKNTIIDYIL